MIYTLAVFILAHLATPYATVISDPFPPCEDATPGAVCVMYDEDRWTITDTDATFTYPTGQCTEHPAPCLLPDGNAWRLVSTVNAPVHDADLGA